MGRTLHRMIPVFLAVSMVLPVLAGEGRIPIWQPINIGPSQEGKYILTRDVTAWAGAPVIDIAPGTVSVDIDLNGFTLHGMDTPIIRAAGVDMLRISNGTISGGTVEGIRVDDVRKVVIEDVKAQAQGLAGFYMANVENVAIRRNIVSNSGADGIVVDNSASSIAVEGDIEDNQLKDCAAGITVLIGRSVGVRNNRVDQTAGGDGIRVNECTGCLVTENAVYGAGAMGLVMDAAKACKVYNNLVVGAQAEGIALLVNSADTLVLHNVSSQNGANGFVTDGMRNHIDQNVFNLNGQAGVWMTNTATDNTFGRNTIRGNTVNPGPCAFNPATCWLPDVCIDGPNNTSFTDNMGPGPGC